MEPVESQSDDPVLRHAVRRALGSETAPPALRNRIQAMLATELRKEQTKAKVFWRRPAFSMVAAAAVLLIGLGIAYQIVNRETEAPKFFADAMVVTHDNCTALSDHHLLSGVSNNANVDELRKKLREQLPHPVLVAMLGEGWQFQGAGVCQISGVPTSHLLFTRNDQTISIFSVSAGAFYVNQSSGNGANYTQTDQGHQIAGFVQGGAIHCLVGYSKSGSLSLKEVKRLRDKVRGDVASADPEFYASANRLCP